MYWYNQCFSPFCLLFQLRTFLCVNNLLKFFQIFLCNDLPWWLEAECFGQRNNNFHPGKWCNVVRSVQVCDVEVMKRVEHFVACVFLVQVFLLEKAVDHEQHESWEKASVYGVLRWDVHRSCLQLALHYLEAFLDFPSLLVGSYDQWQVTVNNGHSFFVSV